MEERSIVKISVRNLVEFILRSGDLVSSFSGASRMTDGMKAHQAVQGSYGEEYTAEVPVAYSFEKEGIRVEIGGRIDGVLLEDETVVIDEIKSTTFSIGDLTEEWNPLHWAQAKCYAFMYGTKLKLEKITIQLTYYQLDSKEIKYFRREYTLLELTTFFEELVCEYIEWAKIIQDWTMVRNDTIKNLPFPFQTYRKGQRELAVAVYRTVKDGKRIFAQAPTGIGKTVATIFPTLKVLGEGQISKIFYLTAKTITRTIAEKAFENMKREGLRCKTITLTAKDKICFQPESTCDPEKCSFAKGHFDRIKQATIAIFKEDSFTRESIERYAKEYHICPFEFSLDLTLWADCIICDYNYVFDPRVYLKRFFLDGGGDFAFLIDEAHNLVDRGREMFSAELMKKDILELKTLIKESAPRISTSLNKINSYFIECRKICEEEEQNYSVQKEAPKDLYPLLREFIRVSEKWLVENKNSIHQEVVLDLYFRVVGFIRTSEGYDEQYVTYFERLGNDLKIKLFCSNPYNLIKEALKRGSATVFFSATLTPLEYFFNTLGGDENTGKLRLASPFPRENFGLLIEHTISTKYKMREKTYGRIVEAIHSIISRKKGNYLTFFPSYKYMEEIFLIFQQKHPQITIICQSGNMSEEQRVEFLEAFSENREDTLVGFAVLGGVFGEGIDLTGDKLLGAIIVGVGLPQICLERNIISEHFQSEKGMGFEYAYVYPGMNKVMQAVGRVIRTEEDRGVVLLIDERFRNTVYKGLFPPEWKGAVQVRNMGHMEAVLNNFWTEEK